MADLMKLGFEIEDQEDWDAVEALFLFEWSEQRERGHVSWEELQERARERDARDCGLCGRDWCRGECDGAPA